MTSKGSMPAGTDALVETEIIDQHRFIEEWLGGTVPRSAQHYAAFVERHTPGFVLHGPGGDAVRRDALMADLEKAHGAVPGLAIEIRGVRVLEEAGDLIAAVYEEHQQSPAETSARRSTVLFVRDEAAPNGLLWRHLHETWIAPGTA
ncbi:DUF4440 domain-containing protein [Actinomadura hibisca]|uniref:DUF4440 domain-containing protein n=1 Tax=Actinomadura hibisca TaxID=68565 RepID=UPI000A93BFCB|nr:DUF4440 domain-containing protein [Actinomadura hibisca]